MQPPQESQKGLFPNKHSINQTAFGEYIVTVLTIVAQVLHERQSSHDSYESIMNKTLELYTVQPHQEQTSASDLPEAQPVRLAGAATVKALLLGITSHQLGNYRRISEIIIKILIKLYPTLPSKLTVRSFCASTANSIGSLLKTSLAYPLTIRATASSSEIPLWLQ